MADLLKSLFFLFSFGFQSAAFIYGMKWAAPWLQEHLFLGFSWKSFGPAFGLGLSCMLSLPFFLKWLKK